MKRIGFLISKLGTGGAERMIVNLANSFARCFEDRSIVLFHFGSCREVRPYEIDQSVVVVCIDDSQVENGFPRRYFRYTRLHRIMKDEGPWELMISFIPQANFMNILLSLRFRYRAIVGERSIRNHPGNPLGTDLIRNILYPFASKVIFQTPEQASSHWRFMKKAVIPNYVSNFAPKVPNKENVNGFFLCVASFRPLKNHQLLIRMYAEYKRRSIAPRDLVLVGSGPDLEKARNLVEMLGLTEKVVFRGETSNVQEAYNKCAVVLLTSDFEGFPNVLIEGISFGRPFISFDIATGPSYIISACQREVGLLAEPFDTEAFVSRMLELDNADRLQTVQRQADEASSVFDEDSILPLWLALANE